MRSVDHLDRGAYLHPERVFCIDREGSMTYAGMQGESKLAASALLRLGADSGTKVAILSPNCGAVLACVFGIERAGAIRVPLNDRNTVEENVRLIESLDVDIVLHHASLSQAAQTHRDRLARPVQWIPMGTGEPGSLRTLARPDAASQTFPAIYDPLRIASIYPTGGTTGTPKGVMHTQQNWASRTAAFAAAFPMDDGPVHLVVAPLTHGAGSIALSLTAQGATHVIMEGFDAKAVMAMIGRHRVTHLFLPPTALYMLLAEPGVREHDYASLRYFMYGAAPALPEKIEEAIAVFGHVMTHSYAQTEALAISYLPPQLHAPLDPAGTGRKHLPSCGRPAVLTDLRIAGADGTPLPHGEAGEIEVRGPVVMAGYYKNPEATAEAMRDGWLRTGDVGYLDSEGHLYISGRSKDMIITGGFNVYPAEVEQVACAVEGVLDCVALGVPDEKWGEAVKLIVQPKTGHIVDPEEVKAICRQRLGGVKAPKSVEVWLELPRSPVGKVLRREVKARFQHEAA